MSAIVDAALAKDRAMRPRDARAFAAGLRAPIRPQIRGEIWVKLWGNLSFNPISALTGATLEQICGDPSVRAVVRAMMVEAQAIAEALGIKFAIDVDKRIAGAEKGGKHKTPMRQDSEAGRAPEIDALVGAVVERGRRTGTPTPHIDTVYARVKLLAKTMDEEGGQVCLRRAA